MLMKVRQTLLRINSISERQAKRVAMDTGLDLKNVTDFGDA